MLLLQAVVNVMALLGSIFNLLMIIVEVSFIAELFDLSSYLLQLQIVKR